MFSPKLPRPASLFRKRLRMRLIKHAARRRYPFVGRLALSDVGPSARLVDGSNLAGIAIGVSRNDLDALVSSEKST
jgi:hypothetical protein